MKTKVPTAEEFINSKADTFEGAIEAAKEFAQLHVKAALQAAAEEANTYYEPHWSGEQEGSTCIDKDSILNAYPKENIV